MLTTEPQKGFEKVNLSHGPYSPSRLIVAKCPQRFYGQYVRKDKNVGQSMAAARGNAIHEVLARVSLAIADCNYPSPSELDGWVAEAIGRHPAAYAQVDMVKDAASAYLRKPSPYITKDTQYEASYAVAMYREQTFLDDVVPQHQWVSVPYTDENGLPNKQAFFGGKLDQVTVDHELKIVTILDHKSTPSATADPDHEFQLGAYAWLVSLFHPGYVMKTVVHYCHPSLAFYSAPTVWTPEDLSEMQDILLRRIFAIESFEEFVAIPGKGCDYCHMTQECDVFRRVIEQKARGQINLNINSVEDLLRIARELHVVDRLKDELNTALKDGIERLCPTTGIDIGGVRYGNKVSEESVDWRATDLRIKEESRRAEMHLNSLPEGTDERAAAARLAKFKGLAGLLEAHGIDSENYRDWSSVKLKTVWRLDRPEFFKDIRPFLVRSSSTRFGAHKS